MPPVLYLNTKHMKCRHGRNDHHPNIDPISVDILQGYTNEATSIGYMEVKLLHRSTMKEGMWEECRIYDMLHQPKSKLHKVENCLSNECFSNEWVAMIAEAEWFLLIEKVYLRPESRGRDFGFVAVRRLIKELRVADRCVVMLEPGPITYAACPGDAQSTWGAMNISEATEKLTGYWKRMGFESWSYTDEAWLYLSTADRLK